MILKITRILPRCYRKRSTLPILSNILLDANNSKLSIIATDLDLIFINEIKMLKLLKKAKQQQPHQ